MLYLSFYRFSTDIFYYVSKSVMKTILLIFLQTQYLLPFYLFLPNNIFLEHEIKSSSHQFHNRLLIDFAYTPFFNYDKLYNTSVKIMDPIYSSSFIYSFHNTTFYLKIKLLLSIKIMLIILYNSQIFICISQT